MTVIGNELALRWNDGIESYFPLEFLRKRCPCAVCAGEKDILGNVYGGQVKLGPESLRLKRCLPSAGTPSSRNGWMGMVPEFILSLI